MSIHQSVFALTAIAMVAACAATRPALPPAPTTIVEDSTVALVTPTGTLYGTLELPARAFPVPVALIIAGSGPTDRNGNSRILPGANNSLRMVARGLAERGIASLRYDKRGIAASAASMVKEEDLRFDNYVSDASAWIRQLRADPRFSTVTVIGHSEGSLIGMLATRETGADGFVSLEGAGRNIKDVLIEQLSAQLQPPMVQTARDIIAKVDAGEKPDSVPPILFALFRPTVQPYLRSWFRYTPSEEIARLEVPSLVVQGTTDFQTSMLDAKVLADGHPRVRLLTIEGMNHVLKNAPPGRIEQASTYSDPTLPVVPKLIEETAAFIKALKKR
ncbi:MAG TPA: alpha/beta fold hydrolase [Gemmatimonadaceae bacterium]